LGEEEVGAIVVLDKEVKKQGSGKRGTERLFTDSLILLL